MISFLHLVRIVVSTLLVTGLIVSGPFALADEPQDRQAKIKTAMVYNFARFASWPPSRLNGQITLCVSPDADLYSALMSLDGKDVEQNAIRTRALTSGSNSLCHIAYLSKDAARKDIVADLSRNSVLTISEDSEVAQTTMISLVKIGRQNRFVINNSLAAQSGIKLSSKLLRIAVEVH